MITPFRRYWLAFLPAVAALAAVVACGDDDDAGGSSIPDASVADTSTTVVDSGSNTDTNTGIVDAGHDADAALPDLCALYPNTVYPGDAAVDEPPDFKRYNLIGYRALVTGASACEVADLFANLGDPTAPPDQIDCLANELASLANCTVGGTPVPYKTSTDGNGSRCSPDAGTSALLGLQLPATPGYTLNDVDFIIDRIHAAAIETGYTAADADRLRQLLRADRAIIVPDAGTTDAGYSQSECQ